MTAMELVALIRSELVRAEATRAHLDERVMEAERQRDHLAFVVAFGESMIAPSPQPTGAAA